MIKRKAVMELNVTKHLFSEDEDTFLNEKIRDPVFLERILLNSESLYKKIKKIKENSTKIDEKTRRSLIKYLLRMAARPQPNRLNAGICLEQRNKIDENKQFKEVDISLEWEQKLINKVEDTLSISSDIKLVLNPTLYRKSTQYILEKSMKDSTSYIYVKNSDFLNVLFEHFKNPTPLHSLLEQYDDSHKKAVFGVIKDLIKADVIKTELSSHSINRDSNAFFNKLQHFCSYNSVLISKIEEIKHSLESYRKSEIGEGIELYQNLVSQMSSLCKSSSYLIVNLYIYDPMNEKEEILRNTDLEDSLQIMNFFDKNQMFDWDRYYNQFVGRYGFYTKVPLLHMIDRDEGLGLPQHRQSNDKNNKIEQYLLNKIMQSNLKQEGKLQLTQSDFINIKEIYGNEGTSRIPTSYDCKLVSFEGKLLLPPNAFSFPRNSFTGRFSLPKNEEPINSPKYSEINYVSNYFKDVGSTFKSEASTFIDCIGHTEDSFKRIPLNEIDILAFNNRLYMVYKEEIVYPASTHLLNYRNFNEHPALIFLNEFYRYCFEYPNNFPLDTLSYLEFLPRVEYKNLILSAAKINLQFDQESTEEERINRIKEIIGKYNFDQFKYLYLLEGDKSLPIPTTNDLSIRFLEACKRKVGEGYQLVLMEAPELEKVEKEVSDWIYSSGQKRFTDKDSTCYQLNKTLEISKSFLDEIDHNVSSYYLYYRSGKREKIENAILKLSEEELFLQELFLVNFIDENKKEHIRLRYKQDPQKNSELEKKLSAMIVSGDLFDYKKTILRPEINRYGGKEVYKSVYKLFAADTISIKTFKELYSEFNETERALYLSCYILLECLGHNTELLYEYLEKSIEKDTTCVKPFAKRRNEYRNVVLKAYQAYQNNSNPLLVRHRKFAEKVYDLSQKACLSEGEFFYLIRSIIHMSMNRHFPFNRDLENEVNQFMRFAFSNIKYHLKRSS